MWLGEKINKLFNRKQIDLGLDSHKEENDLLSERLDVAERKTLELGVRVKRIEIELGIPEPLIIDIGSRRRAKGVVGGE